MRYRWLTLAAMLGAHFFVSPAQAGASATPFRGMVDSRAVRKLYVADQANNRIVLFPAGVAAPKPIGTITKGIASPVDVFVDAAGTLYVANVSSVVEYAAGSVEPKLQLSLDVWQALYITAGPDGTVYVMEFNANGRWRVAEFDVGARKPSRTIDIPYEYPYPLSGGGIAVTADNFLYVNSGSLSGQGDFYISIYPPHQIVSTGGFTSGGYATGGVQIFKNWCFVGDPISNNIEVWFLPAHTRLTFFNDLSSGDYLTFDVASNYLYSISYGTQTLQIYDLRSGRLLNFLTGFYRGVAVDPSTSAS